jgi:nitrite reductase (NO-forming)
MAAGDGIENVYPPLAKSDYLADRERAIHQVIKGSSGEIVVNGKKYNNTMPPQQLTDEEVAAVLTFVYTNPNMGNGGAAVTIDEVKAVRAKM